MLNGVTQLVMTKADVLDNFDSIFAATAYQLEGKTVRTIPFQLDDNTRPVYTELKGWKCNISGIRNKQDFPAELNDYILFLEKELGVPVTYIGVGPDREQIIKVK